MMTVSGINNNNNTQFSGSLLRTLAIAATLAVTPLIPQSAKTTQEAANNKNKTVLVQKQPVSSLPLIASAPNNVTVNQVSVERPSSVQAPTFTPVAFKPVTIATKPTTLVIGNTSKPAAVKAPKATHPSRKITRYSTPLVQAQSGLPAPAGYLYQQQQMPVTPFLQGFFAAVAPNNSKATNALQTMDTVTTADLTPVAASSSKPKATSVGSSNVMTLTNPDGTTTPLTLMPAGSPITSSSVVTVTTPTTVINGQQTQGETIALNSFSNVANAAAISSANNTGTPTVLGPIDLFTQGEITPILNGGFLNPSTLGPAIITPPPGTLTLKPIERTPSKAEQYWAAFPGTGYPGGMLIDYTGKGHWSLHPMFVEAYRNARTKWGANQDIIVGAEITDENLKHPKASLDIIPVISPQYNDAGEIVEDPNRILPSQAAINALKAFLANPFMNTTTPGTQIYGTEYLRIATQIGSQSNVPGPTKLSDYQAAFNAMPKDSNGNLTNQGLAEYAEPRLNPMGPHSGKEIATARLVMMYGNWQKYGEENGYPNFNMDLLTAIAATGNDPFITQ